jgi:hypothetical protein
VNAHTVSRLPGPIGPLCLPHEAADDFPSAEIGRQFRGVQTVKNVQFATPPEQRTAGLHATTPRRAHAALTRRARAVQPRRAHVAGSGWPLRGRLRFAHTGILAGRIAGSNRVKRLVLLEIPGPPLAWVSGQGNARAS